MSPSPAWHPGDIQPVSLVLTCFSQQSFIETSSNPRSKIDSKRLYPAFHFFTHGIEKSPSLFFPNITHQRRLPHDIQVVLVSIFCETDILCHKDIQNRMIDINHFHVL